MSNLTEREVAWNDGDERADPSPIALLYPVLHHAYNTTLGEYVEDSRTPVASGPALPREVYLAVGVLMSVLCVLGTLGNVLVIIVFGCFRSLRKPMNILLINLAFADLIMAGVGSPLVAISSFYRRWAFGETLCQLYAFLMGLSGLASISTMAVIALERVCGVAGNQLKSSLRRLSVWLIVLFTWIYSAIWVLPPLAGWGRFELENYGTSCSFAFLDPTQEEIHYIIYLFTGGFAVPCVIIAGSYAVIGGWVLWHERSFNRQAARMNTSLRLMRQNSRTKNMELRVARVCGTVVMVFLIAWGPYAVVTLLGAFGGPSQRARITPLVCLIPGIFAKMSSMYNPIIYSLTHPLFRKRLRRLVCQRTLSDTPSGATTYKAPLTKDIRIKPKSASFPMDLEIEEPVVVVSAAGRYEKYFCDGDGGDGEGDGQAVLQLIEGMSEGLEKDSHPAGSEIVSRGREQLALLADDDC